MGLLSRNGRQRSTKLIDPDTKDATDKSAGSDLPAVVEAAARGASNLLAEDIVVLMVGDVISITDFFVIASGSNVRQVRRIVDSVEAEVKAAGGEGARTIEGAKDGRWVLMDFGPFVVHIFHTETRDFYDLERLWSDVPRHEWTEVPDTDQTAIGG